MNGILSDPFTISYPTAVQTSLNSGASFAKFDPSGYYVAGGRPDGSAVIWDLDTKAPIRWLEGHVKAVTSVDWSRNSRYVLTSSKDWNVIIWDLASDTDPIRRRATVRFDAPVVSASFHPRNSQIVVVLLSPGDAYLVDLRKQYRSRVELCEIQEGSEDEGQGSRARSAMTVVRFDPTGRYVFAGTSAGSVLVFNTRTKTMIARHKVSGAGIIRGLDFAKGGRLPVYTASAAEGEYIEQELEPTYRFNDPINKNAWHAMAYSPDGEWLAGGAADNASHKIYIWDLANEEPLLHVHWHPKKAAIVSLPMSETSLCGIVLPQTVGRIRRRFEEVDENVEYEEKEDEFDIVCPFSRPWMRAYVTKAVCTIGRRK
ncbi:WD40-repeat-containing domain protein [Fomitopsis serialis]|uniref:WD40-repeat-containing domain protein n=1 Tax=Fomitopsis serialis TaxID=139415 RepID=UPI002007306B|nr:WD40-repeat-containing domain protein [Neoantrodia serialis]KAH9938717.1 WD40-repeat-containing domain protein [Neoantrodia serialis]